ncbi:MAG: DUF4340 domain-containing protein [Methylotenera sp.]|nr:DUF4340 domain-containing protein [Oligoflexia bacterium]
MATPTSSNPSSPSGSGGSGSHVDWKKPLALASTLFVLGSFTYWLEFAHKPKKEEASEKTKKPFDLNEAQVTKVKFSDGRGSFALECLDVSSNLCKPGDNAKWIVTYPIKSKGDDSNVNSLISTINNLQASDTIDLNDETVQKRETMLKEYRLDAGSRKLPSTPGIQLDLAGKASQSVYLGETHPLGSSQYAISGDADCTSAKTTSCRVFLLPLFFKQGLEHDLTYWRDKKVMSFAPQDVLSFELQGSKGKILGERKDGNWLLTQGGETVTGDIENMDQLITAVAYLTAKEFTADDVANPKGKAALEGAKRVLSLELKGPKDKKQNSTLTLLKKKNQMFATVSGSTPLYEVDPETAARLDKGMKDLRLTKLLTTMDRFSAKRIESTLPGSPTSEVLTQKDAKWFKADGSEVENAQIQNLLDKLSGNRIKDFVPASKIPSGESTGVKISLGDEKTPQKRSFVFWKSGEQFYARDLLSQRKEALWVDSAIQDALPWAKDFFKKPGQAKESETAHGSRTAPTGTAPGNH